MRAAFQWFAVGHEGLAVCGAICGQINWLENVRPPYNTSSIVQIYSELTLTNAVPCLCLNKMQNEARPHHRGREHWKQFGAWAHSKPKMAIWLVSNSCWRSTICKLGSVFPKYIILTPLKSLPQVTAAACNFVCVWQQQKQQEMVGPPKQWKQKNPLFVLVFSMEASKLSANRKKHAFLPWMGGEEFLIPEFCQLSVVLVWG